MGISERREREKIERRRAIISCAKELIVSQGVHRVSMGDIARKAELSKATVYLYFSSKETLLNEICEEAAGAFIENLKPFLEGGITGIAALKCFWFEFVELFGNFQDMIIVFQIRNFTCPGLPFICLDEKSKPPNVCIILETMRNVIEQCKSEGVFDPNLDSSMATKLLLSMFSIMIEKAARMPNEERNTPKVIEEMKNAFQFLVRGFAREGIDRSFLNIEYS